MLELGRIACCLVVVATCSCVSSARRQAYSDFGPAAEGAYSLDIRSYPRELSVGDELLARYVLMNTSDQWVRGCVSVDREWVFNGTKDSGTIQRTRTHHTCDPDRQFFLGQGESHSWLDAIDVPDVGPGEAEVIARIEIVLVDSRGRVDLSYRWEVEQSITIDIGGRDR